MEMDKFLVELPAGEKLVVYRPDTESSIVKRPTETSPIAVTEGGSGPDENSYCDCGWPYTLPSPAGEAGGQLGWTAGSVSIGLVARGTPTTATGRIEYRRVAEGFNGDSAGTVTCYLQVGNQGYFSGVFDRPFFSGPTEILFFYGTAIDGDQIDGGVDRAIVELAADLPIPCDDQGTMSFLDMLSANSPVTHGNIRVSS